jgi:O-glycosyl hydrolase
MSKFSIRAVLIALAVLSTNFLYAQSVQNEPLNSRNTPSMYWFENEQA